MVDDDSTDQAAVIDPRSDIDTYLELARALGGFLNSRDPDQAVSFPQRPASISPISRRSSSGEA